MISAAVSYNVWDGFCIGGGAMKCLFSELREKEVISTSTGARIGFIDDIEFDTSSGCITSLVIYGQTRLFGLMGREDNVVISCSDIEKIGEDTVLVKVDNDLLYNLDKNRAKKMFE